MDTGVHKFNLQIFRMEYEFDSIIFKQSLSGQWAIKVFGMKE